jgi:hypothetical protein
MHDETDLHDAPDTSKKKWWDIRQDALVDHTLLALSGVMQQTDRILTGKPLNVRLASTKEYAVPDGTPAWTNGKTIFLNADRMRSLVVNKFGRIDDDKLPNAVLAMKGTNYHEVAHVLFTPGTDTDWNTQVHDWMNGVSHGFQTYMTLEDSRIETMYTSLYKPTVPYFVLAASRWLIETAVDITSNYPLLYGRKYLPLEFRMKVREAFVDMKGEGLVATMEALIDQYVVLMLPQQQTEGLRIIKDLHAVFVAMKVVPDPPSCSEEHTDSTQRSDEHQSVEEQAEGVAAAEDTVRREQERKESGEFDDTDDDTDDEDDADDGESGESGDGEDSDTADTGSSGPGNADGADGEPNGEGTGTGQSDGGDNGTPGKAAGANGGTPPPTAGELLETVKDLLGDALNDESLLRDVEETTNSVRAAADSQMEAGIDYTHFAEVPVPQRAANTARQIVTRIGAMRTDLEAAWLRDQPVGKVDVSRVIRRKVDPSITDVFTAWDEGAEEDAECEAIIAVDLSGSMDTALPAVSEALWILKWAFDRCEIPTTVHGFSNGNAVMYRPHDRLTTGKMRQFGDWGGTDPSATLSLSVRQFSLSSATNKVFVCLTDGSWSGMPREHDGKVGAMRKMGVTTVLMCYDGALAYGNHNFETALSMNDPKALVRVVDKMVGAIMEKALGR